MSDQPIYCPAVISRATRDSPQELCENEVVDHGDLCDRHEEDDRADALYDAWRDSQFDD